MDKTTSEAIVSAIKELVDEISPDVRYVSKYGGEVFCPYPDDDKTFVGGIFAYKEHVSLEFSEGASLDDPHGHLEGTGKHRRHLKLQAADDVEAKDAKTLLKQAFAL